MCRAADSYVLFIKYSEPSVSNRVSDNEKQHTTALCQPNVLVKKVIWPAAECDCRLLQELHIIPIATSSVALHVEVTTDKLM